MKNPCHICNNETKFFLNKDGYSMFKCDSCGLVYMNPLPEQNFLSNKVYSFESGYQGNKIRDLSKAIPDKKTVDILCHLHKNKVSGKLLDVGCSSGEFIYHAKQRGFDSYGVELNSRTADIGIKNGLNIFKGLLNDAKFKDNFFDVIFLGDIIEHVLSPRDFVNECKRVLKKDGIIIISTPNLDCTWAKTTLCLCKTFGIPCSSLTPPYHTFQFSEGNLDKFMLAEDFSKTSSWFYKPPRLMYELGSIHLLKQFKNRKTLVNLFKMIFGFSIYTLSYIMIVGTRVFRSKDFSMICVYKKS
jgi:2-polyprenyl-3-methyl-5-hydroxy-6-metoxy-1,4-benzoquinol methylase